MVGTPGAWRGRKVGPVPKLASKSPAPSGGGEAKPLVAGRNSFTLLGCLDANVQLAFFFGYLPPKRV